MDKMVFEVAAIQFSHKEEKIEEWCKSKTIYKIVNRL